VRKSILLTALLLLTQAAFAGGAKTWYDIEDMDGWQACSACAGEDGDGPVAVYWTRKDNSPSQDGSSREFFLGGGTPYSNVLFSKRLSGDASFIRAKRHFIYDLYFYYKGPSSAVQALEFDINEHIDGKSYIWGTQCNVRAGHTWDIWVNIDKKWVSTGIYCGTPQTYKWNHVVLEMERTSDNRLRYISITYNGTKHYVNRYYHPRANGWTGLTLNYQMDGNARQEDYHTWVDNFKFTTW
jgi:hypothetical protein